MKKSIMRVSAATMAVLMVAGALTACSGGSSSQTTVAATEAEKSSEAAGSETVYELHGSVHRNYCESCGKFYGLKEIMAQKGVPKCSCGGIIKPDVVLYEEGLDQNTIRKSIEAISNADVLIIGGTSLAVYPAAGLIDYYRGNKLVLINKSSTPKDSRADLIINDAIGKVLGQIVE